MGVFGRGEEEERGRWEGARAVMSLMIRRVISTTSLESCEREGERKPDSKRESTRSRLQIYLYRFPWLLGGGGAHVRARERMSAHEGEKEEEIQKDRDRSKDRER